MHRISAVKAGINVSAPH